MGNCFSARKNDQSRKLTLAIFGLDKSGKSSVIKVLQGGSLNEVVPTVGFATNQLKWPSHSSDLTVLDVGGGARIRDIWKNYFAESHGLVFVVDSSDRERINEAGQVLAKVLADHRIQGKPLLLLLNKQDLLGALNDTQVAEQINLEAMVNQNKCPCRVESISATHGTGKKMDAHLSEGFNWIVRFINDHYPTLSEKIARDLEVQRAQLAREREERLERIRKAKEEREALGLNSDDDENDEPKTKSGDKPIAQGVVPTSRQNGHATVSPMVRKASTADALSEVSRPGSSTTAANGHLPPLSYEMGNRQKRKIRPSSSGGRESVDLTNSYHPAAIPHLPPILSPPPFGPRPLPKLPTPDEIPPPSSPPPPPSDSTGDTEELIEKPLPVSPKVLPVASPAFPRPPSFADINTVARNNQQKRPSEGSTVEATSEQAARRKRRKRRLQRFNNQTAPLAEVPLETLTHDQPSKAPLQPIASQHLGSVEIADQSSLNQQITKISRGPPHPHEDLTPVAAD